MPKTNYKEYATIVAIIVGAVAVYKISGGVSKAIENVGEGLGVGVSSLLGGAGAGVASAGQGVEYLGYGAGSGISYLGQGIGTGFADLGGGVGSGVSQLGGGLFEIGKGAGYALSGANVQDIVQTIFMLGRGEASTYNAGVKLTQDTASNQGQDSGASEFAKSQASIEAPAGMMEAIQGSGVFIPIESSQSYIENVKANIAAGKSSPTTTGTISAAPKQTTPTIVSIITGSKGIETPPLVKVVQTLFSKIFRR